MGQRRKGKMKVEEIRKLGHVKAEQKRTEPEK